VTGSTSAERQTMTGSADESGSSGPQYHAYLIRFWRDGLGGEWRGLLAHVPSGETQRFGSPPLLWAYLQAQLDADRGQSEAGSRGEDTGQ
jgi:hypothetical protein